MGPTEKPSETLSVEPSTNPSTSDTPSVSKYPSENPTKKHIFPDFCNRYEQIDDKNVKSAVTLWVDDEAAALSKYGHISDWDTSSITNLDNLFLRKSNFNVDVSGWDTSGVTTMKSTFEEATSFNIDIRGWNVASVANFERMFEHANSFCVNLCSWLNSCKLLPEFNDSDSSLPADRTEPLRAAIDNVTSYPDPNTRSVFYYG